MSASSHEPHAALAGQRQALILDEIHAHGGVRVADLAERLGVSDMTVRRDISELAIAGLLTRVHGGAIALTRSAEEPRFDTKRTLRPDAKAAIAREAASLVKPGDSVAISAGSTALEVARHLLTVPGLTVVTNSIPVSDLLSAGAGEKRSLLVTGGEATPSAALAGPIADAMLAMAHVDWLFLGLHGFDPEAGLTTPNTLEAGTSRAMMHAAERTVVTADSTKWHVRGLWTIAPLEDVDILITDSGLADDDAAAVEAVVGELRRVDLRATA